MIRKLSIQKKLLLVSSLLVGCGSPTTSSVVAVVDSPVEQQAEKSAEADEAEVESSAKVQAAPVVKVAAPIPYTVRKIVTAGTPAGIPRVLLSGGHAKLCKLLVGEAFPALNLPLLGGKETAFESLRGKQATVVLFWHPDRWMARTALIDMQRDIASKFDAKQVAVIGIAVQQPAGAVQAALNKAQATFPQLLDSSGEAFATVGINTLPRLYVLGSAGTVVWFDIEYSEGTRRELGQTLGVLTNSTGK